MTVTNTLNRFQYAGNGTVTAFAFPAPFINPADLAVMQYDTANQSPIICTLGGSSGTGYTITGSLDPTSGEYLSGGTITFNSAPPSTNTVTIWRDAAATQNVIITPNGPLPSATINTALDKLTMLVQQALDAVARAIAEPATDSPSLNTALPGAGYRANQVLGFDIYGQPMTGGNLAALIALLGTGNLPALLPAAISTTVAGAGDQTAALQAVFDSAYASGQKIIIGPGVYETTGVVIYSGQTVEFSPAAQFKMTAAGAGIRGQASPGAGPPPDGLLNVRLIKANIDMNGQNGTGILADCWAASIIDNPIVTGVPAGTWTYTSSYGNLTVYNSAIALYANPSRALAYYNEIRAPYLKNNQSTNSGYGIVFGYAVETSGYDNVNHVIGGLITGFTTGILVECGSDGSIRHTDVTLNDTGIQLGSGTGYPNIYNFQVIHPYMERCTTGLRFSTSCDSCSINGIGSVSGTTTPVSWANAYPNHASYAINCERYAIGGNVGALDGGSYVIAAAPSNTGKAAGLEVAACQGNPAILEFTSSRGQYNGQTATQNLDVIGEISVRGYNGTQYESSDMLNFTATENWSGSANGMSLVLRGVPNGSSAASDQMIVGGNGVQALNGLSAWTVTPPTSRPTITGSRSGATVSVLAQILAALSATGLLLDSTTS